MPSLLYAGALLLPEPIRALALLPGAHKVAGPLLGKCLSAREPTSIYRHHHRRVRWLRLRPDLPYLHRDRQ
jgi:hypothetical protein